MVSRHLLLRIALGALSYTALLGRCLLVVDSSATPELVAGLGAAGLVSSAGAVGMALVWLFRTRLSEPLRRTTWRSVARGIKPLHAVHRGHVGDDATWLTVGPDGPGRRVRLRHCGEVDGFSSLCLGR